MFPTLIPANILIPGILKPKLDSLRSRVDMVLMDGFPRDQSQADHAIRILGKPCMVWNCVCDPAVAKERYLQRQREVDDEDMFDKRLQKF